MERMSAQDAAFLHIENDSAPMHVGGVSIFEGPPPPFDDTARVVPVYPVVRAGAPRGRDLLL
jgi:hypothetical protein